MIHRRPWLVDDIPRCPQIDFTPMHSERQINHERAGFRWVPKGGFFICVNALKRLHC
ncbi:hypothetical protein BN439_2486 [Erwinia amylovora Ea644]|nr:hypothetical protein BN439_2486 [Erwinia amylovora Ea644]CCP07569.1 hypothetical protein BN440_2549 [Erwinia amylovora MR1]